MVATWDDSDEKEQEMSNLVLMAIRDKSFDELDEVRDPTYDELCDAFKGLRDDWFKIGKKNAYLKKKMLELSNEKDALQKYNDSLNEKIKGLELDNEMLHDKIASFKGKKSTLYEHEKLHVDELIKENKVLKKKSNELN